MSFKCLLLTIGTTLLLITSAVGEKKEDNREVKGGREKRQLPLSVVCDPRQEDSCHKGDLIDTKIADCKKTSLLKTCDPKIENEHLFKHSLVRHFSSIVDVPDTSKNRVDCLPDTTLPVTCGAPDTNTRCVCDKAVDWNRPWATLGNQCRCQYWPKVDERKKKPSYCTQYDNGGTSGVHFYTCCNNCKDFDTSCNGRDYQGGGSRGNYCGDCGQNTPLGGGRQTYSFNCVSCSQQKRCEEKCDKENFGIFANIPGFCPKWAHCFRECCARADKAFTALLQEYLD